MKFFKREKFTLRVELDDGEKVIYPGDFLVLTHSGKADVGERCIVTASVTFKYAWDGRTLRQVTL